MNIPKTSYVVNDVSLVGNRRDERRCVWCRGWPETISLKVGLFKKSIMGRVLSFAGC